MFGARLPRNIPVGQKVMRKTLLVDLDQVLPGRDAEGSRHAELFGARLPRNIPVGQKVMR